MAYQVFARKYRPRTFDEVVGQEHIVQTLRNAIQLGRLAQAYLFVGPRGTGKTSTARILAKALNCSDGPKVDFDPDEEICREIAEGNCLDVLEIDGASNNGVEQVRDLRDNVRYAPAKGRFKIYYIDEVHMLTTAAFNALLKTLEEPPAHVKFIFATTEVHKVPPTILSRCQRFDLRRIPEKKIINHLAMICGKEGVEAEPAALAAIARYAEGGLRDAESALDQVISFYGDRVGEAEVLAMFGLTGLEPVAGLAKAVATGDTVEALRISREMIEAGKDLGRLSQDLLRFFRNLTIYHLAPATLEADLGAREIELLRETAGLVSRAGALALMEELSTLESRLRYALAKDVIFEVALIQLSQLRERVSLEIMLRELAKAGAVEGRAAAKAAERVETEAGAGQPAAPAPAAEQPPRTSEAPSSSASAPPPSSSPPAVPSPGPIGQPQEKWRQAVERIAEGRPELGELIRSTSFIRCVDQEFEIGFPSTHAKKLPILTGAKHAPFLQEQVGAICGQAVKLTFLLHEPKEPAPKMTTLPPAEGPSGKPALRPTAGADTAEAGWMSQEEFENDPLIREALEVFAARIVNPAPK